VRRMHGVRGPHRPNPHATRAESGRGRSTLELVGPRHVGYGEINWAARQAGRDAGS
jgi:hypothetical protein